MISGMWRDKLPTEVKQRVAGQSLVGKDAMKNTLKTADAVHTTNGRAAVAAASLLDTSADAPALQQVAAVNRRNPGRKNNATSRQGNSNAGGKSDRGNPHPDGPPPNSCNLHYKYGRNAYKCRKPDTCPWAHICAPKPTNNSA